MMGLKIAVIGAGSTYTPELITGFVKRKDELPIKEICLMDIDRKNLISLEAFPKEFWRPTAWVAK